MQHEKEKVIFRKLKKMNFIVKAKFNDKIDEDRYEELLNACVKDLKKVLDVVADIEPEKFDEVGL